MTSAIIEWGLAARARAGETESGDRALVKMLPEGALVAAVDGLGHGAEAALAADLAIRTVEGNARRPLPEIVEICHRSLQPTRGVALSLALWNAAQRTMTWTGVGNVEGLLLSADSQPRPERRRLLLRPGVVGGRLPVLHASTVPVTGAGLLVFATDGVKSGFEPDLDPRARPQSLADRILARHFRDADDALVLVARLGG